MHMGVAVGNAACHGVDMWLDSTTRHTTNAMHVRWEEVGAVGDLQIIEVDDARMLHNSSYRNYIY
jgi:sporulation protein YlmC with PRC-barrel domain